MIRGHVKCLECPSLSVKSFEADTLEELAALLGPGILSLHVLAPHSSHAITAWIGEADDVRPLRQPANTAYEEKDFSIQCIAPGCQRTEKLLAAKVPVQLVGALAITFHTTHEGHPVEMTWGDRVWKSPA